MADSPSTTPGSFGNLSPGSNPGSNDENPRVKFLCSFLGSIMPRPQDGKLRYVGGETRIVCVPRDIAYEELMSKMRELFEGAAVLKYQQPDEDLDALVSVVNNDDVTNMMEEYDKLGSGDGFTRLRIFLFPHPDQDISSPFVDGDERDPERRYVDALNNLNDVIDLRKQQQSDSTLTSTVDDVYGGDQFFNPMNIDVSLQNQRGYEALPNYNLRHLKIPPIGSAQSQQSVTQRFNEIESPWSPAYYSPGHHGHDSRLVVEYPPSPSSAWYRMPFTDLDRCSEKMPEEYARQHVNHQSTHEHQSQYNENVLWVTNGAITGDKSGFPGNVLPKHNVLDGNGIRDHGRMPFHGSQSHLEHARMMNGLVPDASQCAEFPPNRETFMLNADVKLPHGILPCDQGHDHASLYKETQGHEKGWMLQHHSNMQVEEARAPICGASRTNDYQPVDCPGLNFPVGQNNLSDGHITPVNFHQPAGQELANGIFPDQAMPGAPHVQITPAEERGVRYGNLQYAYTGENHYPHVLHARIPGGPMWRNIQNPLHVAPVCEPLNSQQANGTVSQGYLRGTLEGSPQFSSGVENQTPWLDPSRKILGVEGTAVPEYSYGHPLRINRTTLAHENHQAPGPDRVRPQDDVLNIVSPPRLVERSESSLPGTHDKLVSSSPPIQSLQQATDNIVAEAGMSELKKNSPGDQKEAGVVEEADSSTARAANYQEQNKISNSNTEAFGPESLGNGLKPTSENGDIQKTVEDVFMPPEESKLSANCMSFLPELIASVKQVALEETEEIKAPVAENELELMNGEGEPEPESDLEQVKPSIEPTIAEAEAIAQGLQTIKNDDLEEIRELGSGTYGAVYHGKWKGSDVAIKRIKASCFAGRPSERERLIADFWREAQILNSLHHPNVVSFYGIVRDGPDGSLATVTEFMVNGSLKQFLQKKDRTIDRRKRLIIAMDAAFGMEYLHGKHIVHFDLKCENLLVNMRDPQRPVCKIGDLGLSKVRQHTLVSGGIRGTLPWMAPELLSGKSNMVTEKIDVYSFGIVMWELLTGEEPYADMHCASIIGGIVNNTLRPQIPTWCDPEWKALMESCWDSDPAKRPSFSEISQKLRNMAAAMNVK